MPYIIDGHNLIPKIPGLSLEAMDDELQLVEILQEFCRHQRKGAEVYFDNSPPGQPVRRNFGQVVAFFIRQGTTADDAIRSRLARLGRSARNWAVISSDHGVQEAARVAQAQFLSSEVFASLIHRVLKGSSIDLERGTEKPLSPEELDDWLELFGEDDQE